MIRALEECQLTKLIQETEKQSMDRTELPHADIEGPQKPSWLIQEQPYFKMGKRFEQITSQKIDEWLLDTLYCIPLHLQ